MIMRWLGVLQTRGKFPDMEISGLSAASSARSERCLNAKQWEKSGSRFVPCHGSSAKKMQDGMCWKSER